MIAILEGEERFQIWLKQWQNLEIFLGGGGGGGITKFSSNKKKIYDAKQVLYFVN